MVEPFSEQFPYTLDRTEIWRAYGEIFDQFIFGGCYGIEVPPLPQAPLMVLHQKSKLVVPKAFTPPGSEFALHQPFVTNLIHVHKFNEMSC